MLLVCGKQSGTLTPQMLGAVFAQLISVARSEADASFLSSLFRCIVDCVRVAGGGAGSEPGTAPADALPHDIREGILGAVRHQLQGLADKRKARMRRFSIGLGSGDEGSNDGRASAEELAEEREDVALLEELEDFALDDIAKLLRLFDPTHPLLVAVSSVKELGIRGDSDDTD